MKLIKERIYEKFTDQSDPIEDMGIGKAHWFNEIFDIFANVIFGDVESANIFMDIAYDKLEELYQKQISVQEAADICYDDIDLFNEWEERMNPINQHDLGDDLKSNCRDYQGSGSKEDADELTTYLMHKYTVYPENELRQVAYNWVGVEDESNLINEKFTDESDPIKDMGIGSRALIEKWLKKYHITNYIINKDLTIDVDNDIIIISNNKLSNFPYYIQFGKITGHFEISHNNFTTLKGCPRYVDGWFGCSNNKLQTLDYAPHFVSITLFCGGNTIPKKEIDKYMLNKKTYKNIYVNCDAYNYQVHIESWRKKLKK